ncbi:hypothetical protein WN944_022850 [Citrus x changshan-huyou]|uniref:Uncharacterized protein n=1 Tax=Citrus x changshan-huyou TaxID=2935761 RepID=A0AAP0N4V8_9ROSI
MLGTLPSSYLKWVSKNLRAQDFEHWAMLADQVLQDPVYKDRIEWEFAENVLTGNSNDVNKNKNMATNESSVSRLLELSQRFGWDNEDRVGWSKLNFELLGTSKGGRIPRISERKVAKETLKVQKKERFGGLLLSESEERRRERRMRVKEKVSGVKIGNGNGDGNGGGGSSLRSEKRDQDLTVEIHNPFPGREALLKKVMSRKRFLLKGNPKTGTNFGWVSCHLKQGSDSSSSCPSPTSLYFTAYYNLHLDNNNCSIFALNKVWFEEEIFPARPDTIMLLKN